MSELKAAVKPVSHAMAILRRLATADESQTATQIARGLQLNTSTCFNILRTLVLEGAVDFNSNTKTYATGHGVVKLVRSAFFDTAALAAARPAMQNLAEEFGVTAALWRRMGLSRMVLVATEASSANLRIHLRIGQRLPVLLGSSGRVLAPHLNLSEAELREAFRSLRWSRPLDFDDYWTEVQDAAARGWAMDDGYFSAGIVTVSAPVLDPAAGATHSITALMFRGQHTERTLTAVGQAVSRLAKQLGRDFS